MRSEPTSMELEKRAAGRRTSAECASGDGTSAECASGDGTRPPHCNAMKSVHLVRDGDSHKQLLLGKVASNTREKDTAQWGGAEELARQFEQLRQTVARLEGELEAVREEVRSGRGERASPAPVDSGPTRVSRVSNRRQPDPVCVCVQVPVQVQVQGQAGAPGRADASLAEWALEGALDRAGWADRESACFSGAARPYRFRLEAANTAGTAGAVLVHLLVLAGPQDARLSWPFRGKVTVALAGRGARRPLRLTHQCCIERPPDEQCSCRHGDPFRFTHAQLRTVGIDLAQGVTVSCQIVPDPVPA